MKAPELVDMILRHAGVSRPMTEMEARAQARAGKLTSEAIGKALDAYVDDRIALALRDNKVRGKQ